MNAISKINEKAMLVSLSMSCWSAARNDKAISDEIAKAHGADKKMGNYRKYLIDPDSLTAITKITAAARKDHYTLTLPWSDDGYRMISSRAYEDYKAKMKAHKEAYWDVYMNKFKPSFPALVRDAKTALNGMFKIEDYPDYRLIDFSDSENPKWISQGAAVSLDKKFNFMVTYAPVPIAEDFRVNISAQELEEVRTSCTNDANARLHQAVSDVWARFHDVVAKMVERLKAYGQAVGEGERGAFFTNSLITNITDLLAIVPALNVMDDPQITAVANEIRIKLTTHSPVILRNSEATRLQVAKDAESIMNKMAGFLS